MKSRLNVFKYGMYKVRSISSLFANVRQFFRNIKYAWQRATRGYCDWDTWDLDHYYAQLMIESLEYYRSHLHSYPGREPWITLEAWNAYINEIIAHLTNYINEDANEHYRKANEYMDRILHTEDVSLKEAYTKEWARLINKSDEYREQERQIALKMINECWNNLWD